MDMVLYDEKGNEQYFHIAQVRGMLINYNDFCKERKAFEGDPNNQNAGLFLLEVKKMKEISKFLRNHLPEDLQLREEQLNKLEAECKKYIIEEPAFTPRSRNVF